MLIIALFALFTFYQFGGFKLLLNLAILETDENPPALPSEDQAEEVDEIYYNGVDNYNQVLTPAEVVTPEPLAPPQIRPYNPPPIDEEREKLENTAAGMLTACGCKFNVYWYCHELTDRELMDIIKDFNLNK